MKKSFQKKIEYPETNLLDRNCRWVCPEFEPVDGIGEQELWTLGGLIVAIGFINNEKQRIIGSGVMIAPGLCLTATHVIEETREKNALLYSFASKDSMRIWTPEDFHVQKKISLEIIPFQKTRPKYSDVGLLSYSPLSKFTDKEEYLYAPLEVSAPKINERLWAVGYREIHNDGVPNIAFFTTSGIVTEQYLQGRGGHINNPCVEVAMDAWGGMSGGPVFNSEGRVVGIISSSLESHGDFKGPTYVSLIWTSLLSKVYTPWPKNHWPENVGGIQTIPEKEGVRLIGSARFDADGLYKVMFPRQSSDEMLLVLKNAGVDLSSVDYSFDDFVYENFEEFLEEEGLKYLSNSEKRIFDAALIDAALTETLKLFHCFDSTTMGGIEDLNIESVKLLENGNIGIDALFNIRHTVLRLKILSEEHEYHKDLIISLTCLYAQDVVENYVHYDLYARPYYRVNFTYNIKSNQCEDLRFQVLSLKI